MKRKLTVAQALEVVDDDLPDGAWMAMLEELTGLDAGDVSSELAKIARQDTPHDQHNPEKHGT